jgi:perosamine synthetase
MIRVCEPEIGKEELDNAMDAVKTGMVSGTVKGYIGEFEKGFSGYHGRKHGIATTSGTTALHLAVASLGLGKGDEVITSALTNAATSFSIVYSGAKPVLVDSEQETWNLDVGQIEEKITAVQKDVKDADVESLRQAVRGMTSGIRERMRNIIEELTEVI